jgi:hypothetical protein
MSLKTFVPAAFATLLSATLFAQGPAPGGPGGPAGAGHGGPWGQYRQGRPWGPMGFNLAGRATVTGAPFSGTEMVTHQETLADGNQITHQAQSTISRDSQGRVRIDRIAGSANPAASHGTAPDSSNGPGQTLVTIFDPVAGYSYVLNTSTMTAMRMAIPSPSTVGQSTDGASQSGSKRGKGNRPAPQREDLGSQVVNGVSATGTRITATIPAGAMGNQQAIQSVREVWTATDLKIPVLVKATDPHGNTVAQVTNIVQGEPDSSLFQVPTGYTMTDSKKGRGYR